jgi:hypothetical protein
MRSALARSVRTDGHDRARSVSIIRGDDGSAAKPLIPMAASTASAVIRAFRDVNISEQKNNMADILVRLISIVAEQP